VTRLHHAQLVRLEMIWYVTSVAQRLAAGAASPCQALGLRHSERQRSLTPATVPLASNHHGSCTYPTTISITAQEQLPCSLQEEAPKLTCHPGRLAVLGRRLLPRNPFPDRLPVQAPESELHHAHLPPQHQLKWQHLSGHPAGPVESCSDHLEGYACFVTIFVGHHLT
jgi:hypothetical protein